MTQGRTMSEMLRPSAEAEVTRLREQLAATATKLGHTEAAMDDTYRGAIAAMRERDLARAESKRLREALTQIQTHLTNLQPHIVQACYPGREGFIDNYVGPCLEIADAALTRTEGGASNG